MATGLGLRLHLCAKKQAIQNITTAVALTVCLCLPLCATVCTCVPSCMLLCEPSYMVCLSACVCVCVCVQVKLEAEVRLDLLNSFARSFVTACTYFYCCCSSYLPPSLPNLAYPSPATLKYLLAPKSVILFHRLQVKDLSGDPIYFGLARNKWSGNGNGNESNKAYATAFKQHNG